MKFPEGLYIAFGILAYVILWRHIFLQFFKLVKQPEDSRNSFRKSQTNLLDISLVNFNESTNKDCRESCKIIAKTSPWKPWIVSCSNPLLILTLQIHPESRDPHQFHRRIYSKNHVLEKVEHSYGILDACLCFRPTGHCRESIMAEEDGRRNSRFEVVKLTDDTVTDTPRPGNSMFTEIDESFDTFPPKECHATPLDIQPIVQLGAEEKDLNTMIRRLVAAELIKCCGKEHATMSRAHSDTNNRVNWKRNNVSVCGKYDQIPKEPKPYTGNPESSTFRILVKKCDDEVIDLGEEMNKDLTQKSATDYLADKYPSRDLNYENDNDGGSAGRVGVTENNDPILCNDSVHRIIKPSEPEDPVSAEQADTQLIRACDVNTTPRIAERLKDAATQTEQMYLIRAVRSCPGRRRRPQLIENPREMTKGRGSVKIEPMEISLPAFLYRKASDNLIYEKGKGSHSPSYIPVTERFRWRYVVPNKVK